MAGVLVQLHSAATPVGRRLLAVVESTVSDAFGYWEFTSILPGSYYATFTMPAGISVTTQNAGGANATDSSAIDGTGATPNYNLTEGFSLSTVSAGLVGVPAGFLCAAFFVSTPTP